MFSWRARPLDHRPAYYKWTQWVFLQLFKRGLAYKKKGAVNWCPSCKTVLANEQVIAGACERCGTVVEQRVLEQWYFRITDYAERLLANLDDSSKMDWSDDHGAGTEELDRSLRGRRDRVRRSRGGEAAIRVYTTRPDTLFGATFMVLAPEHPLVDAAHHRGAARGGARRTARRPRPRTSSSRKIGDKEKTGVFTGGFAINPATGTEIPVWIADYVLMDYGTGAIMAVPGHDERDFAFATQVRAADRARGRRTGRIADDAAHRGLHRRRRRGHAGQLRRSSTARTAARGEGRDHRLARDRGARHRARCSTGCTTGASRASATGVRRSRSSTATTAAPCRCPRTSCRSSCR